MLLPPRDQGGVRAWLRCREHTGRSPERATHTPVIWSMPRYPLPLVVRSWYVPECHGFRFPLIGSTSREPGAHVCTVTI